MRRRVLAAVTSLCFTLLALGGPLYAAQAQQPGQPNVPPPYKLQPGDVITVTVSPQGGIYNKPALKVGPDGRIYYPVVGEIVAVGKTIPEIVNIIQKGLEAELKGHRVTVEIVSTAEPMRPGVGPNEGPNPPRAGEGRITVMGAVKQPQVMRLLENMTLVEALVNAQGTLPSADPSHITITRSDLTAVTVDLNSDIGRGFRLQNGDIVYVPDVQAAGLYAAALGEVMRPGPAENLRPGATILDLIKAAGGPTTNADLKDARFHHLGETDPAGEAIDLEALWVRGEISLNRRLLNGDTISVPRNATNYVYVLGGVAKPGAYPVHAGEKLADILAQGGTPSDNADLNKVTITRMTDTGARVSKKLDLAKMNQGDTTALSMDVQPGDIIVVPTRKQKDPNKGMQSWAMISSILSLVTSLGTLSNSNRNNNNRNNNGGGLGGTNILP